MKLKTKSREITEETEWSVRNRVVFRGRSLKTPVGPLTPYESLYFIFTNTLTPVFGGSKKNRQLTDTKSLILKLNIVRKEVSQSQSLVAKDCD